MTWLIIALLVLILLVVLWLCWCHRNSHDCILQVKEGLQTLHKDLKEPAE